MHGLARMLIVGAEMIKIYVGLEGAKAAVSARRVAVLKKRQCPPVWLFETLPVYLNHRVEVVGRDGNFVSRKRLVALQPWLAPSILLHCSKAVD
ncbi:MAG: hypothetical protein QOI31_1764 [Solirubrobacterales bacterium]|nr:hypothetical protein [Solirubrobacterales bacterium]